MVIEYDERGIRGVCDIDGGTAWLNSGPQDATEVVVALQAWVWMICCGQSSHLRRSGVAASNCSEAERSH
jgi:SH3-like domain-containing protein